jgi:hypothetical protein
MRKVVDSNCLRAPALRQYLSASRENYAVVTDYAAMEAYKGDTLTTICRSMQILSEFPDQVIILKSTTEICGIRGIEPNIQDRMIDREQTAGFRTYCRRLAAAIAGNQDLEQQLLAMGKEATHQIERIRTDAVNMPAALDAIAREWSQGEIQTIRTGATFSAKMTDKMMKHIMTLSAFLLGSHPAAQFRPDFKELQHIFIFRAALCHYLLAIRWIETGATANRNTNIGRMVNDLVDSNFAAFATYFDGLLTSDAKLNEIHLRAKVVLNLLAPDPIEPHARL